MWKIILLIFFSVPHFFIYGQQQVFHVNKCDEYISVLGREGISEKSYFNIVGRQKYVELIKTFETNFSKINNGYSDYYREYYITGGIKYTALYVRLIPKNLITEKDRSNGNYYIKRLGSKKTLEVKYDIKKNKFKIYHMPFTPREDC